ncbi:putative GTPase, partial [Hamiltosporidium tvaerminnensis]
NKKEKGGITVIYNYNQSKDEDAVEVEIVKGILTEYRINNAEVVFNEKCSVDEFIDCVDGNRKYVPCLYVLNKIDCIGIKELDLIYRIPNCVPVCAHLGWNFDDLLSKSWDYLKLIRVYAKPRGMAIDYEDPVILREERKKIEDFCNSIHKSIMSKFKYALVWGTSVKHNPQRVGKDHVLNDSDVVQIVKGV